MRISDWSSDVCSSDLLRRMSRRKRGNYDKKMCFVYGLQDGFGAIRYVGQTRCSLDRRLRLHLRDCDKSNSPVNQWLRGALNVEIFMKIGRASCRERVCQ